MGAPLSKSNSEYSELLEKLNDIPTLPVVAMKVNELINDPKSSSSDIAEVLKKDQVLTAKILRLVNSSYYSIPGGVTDGCLCDGPCPHSVVRFVHLRGLRLTSPLLARP